MIVALIDNGSLEPAAHRNLRAVAAALSAQAGVHVHAVSWKHSDRIPAAELDDAPAWALGPFVRAMAALGQREFVLVPFFISSQGAIGSALRRDLEGLQHELAPAHGIGTRFEFTFTAGLAACGVIPGIVAERIRAAIADAGLIQPPVVVVDHGGPSSASAALRDRLSAQIRGLLGADIGPLAAASMEGAHPPLLAEILRDANFTGRDVVVAPLFLSPGRHAGPDGDIAQICADAATAPPDSISPSTRCHLTQLVGTHPAAIAALAAALRHTLSTLHAQPFA